jgi:HK97 family phage portal protein
MKNSLQRLMRQRLPGVPLVRSLNKPIFPGTDSGSGASWINNLPRGEFDYDREAGPMENNSAVFSCLKTTTDAFTEAATVVERLNAKGKFERVVGHPGEALLRYPNPCIARSLMWETTLHDLADVGNAYWYMVRSGSGKVVQLWPTINGSMVPMWAADGTDFISYYEYTVGGSVFALPAADVVHFRDGLNRKNHRLGMGRLHAVKREICTDNEATVYEAAMLRNSGIPGIIISPKTAGGQKLSKDERRSLVDMFMQKFRGERRGEPLVQTEPIDITVPGFSPKDMTLETAHQNPESRIAAVLNTPAMVAGLAVGDNQRTYSNFKEAREAFYEMNIMTKYRLLAEQLDMFVLPNFDDPRTHRFAFDTSEVRALQPDKDALHKRTREDYKAGILKRKSALRSIGEEFDEKLDDVYFTDLKKAKPAGEQPATAEVPQPEDKEEIKNAD